MAKRKKHPTLPNGWGTIRYLGDGRSRPYAVHPPCTEKYENGHYKRPPALCYCTDWYTAFAVLNSYRAGTYHSGDELKYPARTISDRDLDEFCQRLMRDRSFTAHLDDLVKQRSFADVYNEWFDWKFGENAPKTLSDSTKRTAHAAFLALSPLHNRAFSSLRLRDLQNAVNECDYSNPMMKKIAGLLKQLYRYAIVHEYIDRDYSSGIVVPQRREVQHGIPFTDADLTILWENQSDPTAELLLILCYSGWRIGEVNGLTIDWENRSFTGGIKTEAGKNRTVPIHSAIFPLVRKRMERQHIMLSVTQKTFVFNMRKFLTAHGMDDHTPHDCRHTFSMLCERYGVREADRKRMLGHSVGDVTNDVYGHRSVEDLRNEIEKIVTNCVQ